MDNSDGRTGQQQPASIADRLSFMGIERPERETLADMRPAMADILDESLSEFYKRVHDVPELARFFPTEATTTKARSLQHMHWDTILSGKFGPDYVADVTRIGLAHARIGLEPRWYIDGYAVLLDAICRRLIRRGMPNGRRSLFGRGDAAAEAGEKLGQQIGAIIKSTFLDMDLVISTYLARLEEERQKAASERSALEQIAQALERVAEGDLSATLAHDVAERSPVLAAAFAKLKTGLNGVVSDIREVSTQVEETATSISQSNARILSQNEAQVGSIHRLTDATASLETSLDDVSGQTVAAEKAVRQCVAAAERGNVNMHDVRATMADIQAAWKTISDLVGSIQNIAAQTNFLALNANVEATRAGEMGRGFSVVAMAIRDLSVKTSQAARQIAASAQKNEAVIRNGADAVSQMVVDLSNIGAGITVVNDAICKINKEMGGQQQSVKGTHREAAALRDLTEKTSAMSEHASRDCQHLTSRSARMVDLVSNFVLSEPGLDYDDDYPIAAE
ncbi:protoglobin domain-containing protein [Acetobacter ghanensis]|uniref:protoglobin domain-containing protein n=1 Tax=Acetobacter ghanensis TaxID=431306 RepID=UPI003D32C7A4